MRIAICEDEKKYTEWLVGFIKEWSKDRNVPVEIFTRVAAEKFLHDWADSEDYDMIFLDIQMGSMTGMELAKIIRRTNKNLEIVFTTSFKEYAIEGYDVDAMRFLVKPIKEEDCFFCLDRVYQSDRSKKYFIFDDLEKMEKTIRIPHEDIIYIEKFAHNATIVTATDKYTVRKTVKQLLEELNDNLFVQCHKSYIINVRRIKAVSKSFVFMSNGAEVPLSQNLVKEINAKFYDYNVNKV